jgi:sodium-dependent dicarboxylate transporter 2/3/5
METTGGGVNGPIRVAGLAGGLLAFVVLLAFVDLDPARPVVTRTAAVAALMAIWWITEAVPLPVTALAPVILFPALGVMGGKSAAGYYVNDIIFLFLGGFMMAQAMERWGLHKRIALRTLLLVGAHPWGILFGFMVAAGFLSMWISNTAAAMIMVPIVMAVGGRLEEECGHVVEARNFTVGLLLGVAYACSIGGVATLVGTPPNAIFTKILAISFPGAPTITFAQWFLFGLPVALVFGAATWGYLGWRFVPPGIFCVDRSAFTERYAALGPASYEERATALLFGSLASLWMTRADLSFGLFTLPGWGNLFPQPSYLTDGSVSVAVAGLLFLLPSTARRGERLLDWEGIGRLPWGIVLLFGGGFALAGGFRDAGLSLWMGERLAGLKGADPLLSVMAVNTFCTFLTELTSNTATSQVLLPILASLSTALGLHPLFIMLPATVAHSFAFMLPVATPPNAIIFGAGRVTVGQMARTGLALNLLGIVILTVAGFTLAPWVFDFDPLSVPVWGRP